MKVKGVFTVRNIKQCYGSLRKDFSGINIFAKNILATFFNIYVCEKEIIKITVFLSLIFAKVCDERS